MRSSLLIASQNQGKCAEFSAALAEFNFEIHGAKEIAHLKSPEEPHQNYQDNALAKATYYFDNTNYDYVLADDSGIEIEALKGQLGVQTRRFGLGEKAPDHLWLEHFLQAMEQFPDKKDRAARFVSVLCLRSKQETLFFTGYSEGTLAKTCLAPIISGIPLSSIFVPDGFTKPFAALSMREKNQISHRGKAITQLINYLKQHGPN